MRYGWSRARRPGSRGWISLSVMRGRNRVTLGARRQAVGRRPVDICNHSFRGTGLTLYMDAGSDLEAARQLAGHANIKTTQLYNRSGDKKQKAEIERVQL